MKKKEQSSAAVIGGKGHIRRKGKAVRKNAQADDKRLKTTLAKLNVRDIPGIEEVNLFKDDGYVIHFSNPKVQASIPANTYVVSGTAENKNLQELLPGIVNQLGRENLGDLQKIYQSMSSQGGAPAGGDDEDDVPDLVENFEEVSKGAAAPPVKEEPVKAADPVKADPQLD